MKTKVISLYGGPGTGKSTTAAGLFAELKWMERYEQKFIEKYRRK